LATKNGATNGNGNGYGGVPAVSFAKLSAGMNMPNLLDVQLRAFRRLLQTDDETEAREDIGLERVFNEVFPITDVNEKFSLEFVAYTLGDPKYSVEECIERDMTFAAPLKATLRLVVWEDLEDGERRPKDIIEKEVSLGDLPLLTELGTFIINAQERVIVSQLHCSPGVVFEETIHPNGSKLFSARIIPFRGSWSVHCEHSRRGLRSHRQEEEVPATRCARSSTAAMKMFCVCSTTPSRS
jgi:DNA-directed RNA polymerase subunit beta